MCFREEYLEVDWMSFLPITEGSYVGSFSSSKLPVDVNAEMSVTIPQLAAS